MGNYSSFSGVDCHVYFDGKQLLTLQEISLQRGLSSGKAEWVIGECIFVIFEDTIPEDMLGKQFDKVVLKFSNENGQQMYRVIHNVIFTGEKYKIAIDDIVSEVTIEFIADKVDQFTKGEYNVSNNSDQV